MPGLEAAVEAEMLFNGGDERAAKAIVLGNTDLAANLEAAKRVQPEAA